MAKLEPFRPELIFYWVFLFIILFYFFFFQAVHSGRGLDWEGGIAYKPTVYREKPSVEADIRVGMSLWHFLEEEHGAGRCYHGTVKALRASNCIVEYDLAERFPESGRNPYPPPWDNATSSFDADASSGARTGLGTGDTDAGDWNGAGNRVDGRGGTLGVRASSCEEVCVHLCGCICVIVFVWVHLCGSIRVGPFV